MLQRLVIENIALVKKADIALQNGLNVLTGETGAGKSIVVNALSLILGERADTDFIRHGENKAFVKAEFDLTLCSEKTRKSLAGHTINYGITIERELSRDSASKVKINSRHATITQLKEIAPQLAQILGQHAGQMLLSESNHLRFLDSYADTEKLCADVKERFTQWHSITEKLRKTRLRRQQLSDERELLIFQKNEIEKATITPGEEERILAERKILDSARTLMAGSSLTQEILGAEDQSVLTLLSMAIKEIEKLAAIDDDLTAQLKAIEGLRFELEDIRAYIEQYGASIEDNPARIEEINLRLDELFNLKKKYGGSEEAILTTLAEINQRLTDRPDVDDLIIRLETESNEARNQYSKVAIKLSEKRTKASHTLKRLIKKELSELAIEHADFEFEFVYEDDPDGINLGDKIVRPFEFGLESGRILFTANPGQPLKPLVKTASGGEISRLFLALKAVEKKSGRTGDALLVFDEVDAGIGGVTGNKVGEKLKNLAKTDQILVVTHLHQIARLADLHLVANKSSNRIESSIEIEQLSKDNVKSEIDRMVAMPEEGL